MIAPIDVTDIRMETDRLILRPWREEDLQDFYEYARVDGVGQMAGWAPHQSLEESRRILDSFIRHKKTFALELKENGRVIGSLGLEERDGVDPRFMGREIGYVLSRDYWGRGLMPEAVKAVIDYCFRVLSYDWLTCGHFEWNIQSRRVVEKCGFVFWKTVDYTTRMGTIEPARMYYLENEKKIAWEMCAPVDASAITVETERLLLRPVRESDLTDLHAVVSDQAVAESAGFPLCTSLEDSQKRVKAYIEDNETLALEWKQTGTVIGTISMQKRFWAKYPIDRKLRGRELGFDLGQAYWGRGFMPEAVQALCDYCFRELHHDFITCGHFTENSRSARSIEKSGFSFLFDTTADYPDGRKIPVRAYIRYNPKKEEE